MSVWTCAFGSSNSSGKTWSLGSSGSASPSAGYKKRKLLSHCRSLRERENTDIFYSRSNFGKPRFRLSSLGINCSQKKRCGGTLSPFSCHSPSCGLMLWSCRSSCSNRVICTHPGPAHTRLSLRAPVVLCSFLLPVWWSQILPTPPGGAQVLLWLQAVREVSSACLPLLQQLTLLAICIKNFFHVSVILSPIHPSL